MPDLLGRLYTDPGTAEIFSEASMVTSWLATEASLARAQARLDILTEAEAEAIAGAAVLDNIDLDRLWCETRNVGYPILPLVRMITAVLPSGPRGRVHYGATTQDIMDTGLAQQLDRALDRLRMLIGLLAHSLAGHVRQHRMTVMAARTHAQQAVPTTFGAVLAGFLGELDRHRTRLREARPRVSCVSLFGAGGTSAAYGPQAAQLRSLVAADLGLTDVALPWHVSRDGLVEFGNLCGQLAGTCARLGHLVIDLSRTEIGEISEASGHHRGASSTMAQKSNPILSEALIGMAGTAGGLAASLTRTLEAGHERAAGEWQIEWQVLPRLAILAGSALATAAEISEGLVVHPEAMARNLGADGGAIMAEAYMMRLAVQLGRERAHDLMYETVRTARAAGTSLEVALTESLATSGLPPQSPIVPADYVGEAVEICDLALARWASGS